MPRQRQTRANNYKVRFPKPPSYYNASYQNLQNLFTQANVGGPGAQILNIQTDENEMIIHFVEGYVPNAAQRTAIKETAKNLVTITEDSIDIQF